MAKNPKATNNVKKTPAPPQPAPKTKAKPAAPSPPQNQPTKKQRVVETDKKKKNEFQDMSVDDFMSFGLSEEDLKKGDKKLTKKAPTAVATPPTQKPQQKAKIAVPLPSFIAPIKGKKAPVEMSEEDDDGAEFDEDDEAQFDDEDDDEDLEFDDDDLYGDEDDESALGGGFFERDEQDEDDDEDEEFDEASHAAQLKELKTKDPELYKLLLQTSPDMLKFGNDEGSDDDDSDEEDSKALKKKKQPLQQSKAALTIETLTSDQFDKLKSKFDRRIYSAIDLVLVIRLFKSAVVVRKKANQMQSKANRQGKQVSQNQNEKIDSRLIMLTSSSLYQHFLQFALRVIPCALMELLHLNNDIPIPFLEEDKSPEEIQARGNVPDTEITWKELSIALSDGVSPLNGKLTQLAGWTKVSTLTRIYFLTVSALLRDSLDSGLIRLILRSILPAVPLLESVQIPTPLLLRRLLHFWCYTTDISYTAKDKTKTSTSSFKTDHVSRIEAFLVLRRLAMCLPASSHIKEAVMKGIYQNFARVAKHVTSYSYPTIVFLINCIVELYGIDAALAYQLTFVYLRQLATQLRAYLVTPSSKGLRAIYNWQFINCLRVWGQVLSTYATDANSALRPLIYPFTQICTTILSLSSAPAFFPVKVTVCDLLTELMEKSKVFIPISTPLIGVLRHPCFGKNRHTTINKHQSHLQKELTYKLHIAEGLLDSLQYKENIASRVLDILTHHLTASSQSVFFPEYSYPIRNALKQLLSIIQIPTIAKEIRSLQTATNDSVQIAIARRIAAGFTPRDIFTKEINGLTVMGDLEALTELNPSTTPQSTQPLPLHTLWHKRQTSRAVELDNEARQRQLIAELGEPDGDDDDDDDEEEVYSDDDNDDDDDETFSHSMKRKATSQNVDDDDDQNDIFDNMSDVDVGFSDDDDDVDQDDVVGDFDMLEDSD